MNTNNIKWKRGDIHPVTGMCFWQYSKCCKNGEYWVAAVKFEESKKYHGEYRKNNRDLFLASKRKHRINNLEKLRSLNKEYKSKSRKKSREYESRRIKDDPLFSLAYRCRRRIASAFRAKKTPKTKKSYQIIGCDWDVLKSYFDTKFTDGMSWDNRHLWHIDHIIPLSSASSPEELIALCHYTNLQPLWASDNLKKSAKLTSL